MDILKNKTDSIKYAGFLERLAARIIDNIICTGIWIILTATLILIALTLEASSSGRFGISYLTIFIIPFIVIRTYFVVLHVWSGQTIGKKIMHIKLVKTDMSKVTLGTALIREVAELISIIFYYIGYLWIIIDKKKQGWHDKLAKTYVIKVDEKSGRD